MTERPVTDPTVTDHATDTDRPTGAAAIGQPTGAAPAAGDQPAGAAGPSRPATPAPSRPGPRPSPTSRARRSAAAAPDGLRRPSPRPTPASVMATAAVASDRPGTVPEQPAGTDQTPGPDTGDRDADNPHADTLHADDLHADDLHADDLQADNLDAEPAELVSRPLAAEPSRRTPAWLVVVMAILLVALAGLDGWLVATRPDSGSRAERDQALSTAKTAVPLILSYDYQHFDSAVSAAKAQLTGRAVEDYVRAMTKTIQPSASKAHSVVQAQTDGAGVEAVSGNGKQVTVVVFGEQKVTNISLTAPRIDLFRVRVTLDLVQGRWLVSKFDQI